MANVENPNGHAVDIDEWARSLSKELEDVPEYMCRPAHPGRITRIPENLRQVDVKAYEPCFISIGPYHHGTPKLQPMEQRKWLVLKHVLENRPELTLKHYLKVISIIEMDARSFYTEVQMGSEKFSRMLLLDSIYILTVFCGMAEKKEINQTDTRIVSIVDNNDSTERTNQTSDDGNQRMDENDNTRDQKLKVETRQNNAGRPRWTRELFLHDLFLVENQLPFFVLQRIYNLAYGRPEQQLLDTMKARIARLLVDYVKLDSELVISPTEEVHHLLHLCHLFFRPTVQHESTNSPLLNLMSCFDWGVPFNFTRQEFDLKQGRIQPGIVF